MTYLGYPAPKGCKWNTRPHGHYAHPSTREAAKHGLFVCCPFMPRHAFEVSHGERVPPDIVKAALQ